ncbi:MAG: hypothetical protein MUF18_14150 [Fimbriiglobus sp.]|nr:hypothetical protein [Fimbriiglobus sp.]
MIVAKVGGSLLDLPWLGDALTRWASQYREPVLLVPGGGAFTDVIRAADETHRLGEETAHWLALRTLTVTAHLLVRLLPDAEIVTSPSIIELEKNHRQHPQRLFVLDPFAFFQEHDTVPHTWAVTSDSLALAVALHTKAEQLLLLKSVDVEDVPWVVASARGWVDDYFPDLVERAECRISMVNFRALANEWYGPLT